MRPRSRRTKKIPAKVGEQRPPVQRSQATNQLTESLAENMAMMAALFENDHTFIIRPIQGSGERGGKFCLFYCDGLVDALLINEFVIKPLMEVKLPEGDEALGEILIDQVLAINEIKRVRGIKEIVEGITYGDAVLLAEGLPEAIIMNTKKFLLRAIAEPDGEKVLSGPREGFCESLSVNLGLIRRKLRTNDLKMKFLRFGQRTNTQACICYLEKLINPALLAELERRLSTICLDGVLDTNYLTEMIKDAPLSPFRTTGYTERPDVVAGKLLEGRIAVLLDGTPVVMTVPYLFIENFQSNEDYYLNYIYSSLSRMLRILGYFLTITVPGFYVAVVAYHHEILPTPLLINIASEQQSVPLPAALEVLIMLIIFEVLKETGVRMPSGIGQALSIVGALVIGQAAVEAKLVASPMIIVVALTGITSLLVPKMNASAMVVRILLLALASMLGMYGFALGLAALLIHLLNLRSFGISQMSPSGKLQYAQLKDTVIRGPWWRMVTRVPDIVQDVVRMERIEEDSDE